MRSKMINIDVAAKFTAIFTAATAIATNILSRCSSLCSIHSPLLPATSTQIQHKNGIQSGFSLIELVISIAIIGILAGVAIPTYVSYTKNQDVSAALASLMNAAVQMEKQFIDRDSYKCDVLNVASKNYTFACSLSEGYLLTANSNDTKYSYTINQSGVRATTKYNGSSNPSNANNCWKVNDNGCY